MSDESIIAKLEHFAPTRREHLPLGEEKQKQISLSQAIRIGALIIADGINYMPSLHGVFSNDNTGCALCAGWLGMGKTPKDYWDARTTNDTISVFQTGLGISRDLTRQIDLRHCAGTSREQIADWLESIGY